jgi:hypothetical protein
VTEIRGTTIQLLSLVTVTIFLFENLIQFLAFFVRLLVVNASDERLITCQRKDLQFHFCGLFCSSKNFSVVWSDFDDVE